MKPTALLTGAALFIAGCTDTTPAPRARTASPTKAPTTIAPSVDVNGTEWNRTAESGPNVRRETVSDEQKSPQPSLPTAADNGMTARETSITASIRQEIMDDSSLSFSAKNAKVITVGGKVTLRGGVPTQRERTSLGGLAMATEGVTEVDNQLEVMP